MKNPIQSYDFFATPENMDALEYNRDQYHGGEKTAFTMGMMLTWNYLSAELDKWIAAQKPEPITVIWGEMAVRQYEEGETSREVLTNGGCIDTYQFQTHADLDLAMRLMADADGWNDSVVVEGVELTD